jgi:osomolarity two-component system, sensor histidine kinase NIK1
VAVEKYTEAIKNGLQYLLIFMDVCMPTMDGMEASKLIRTFEKENNANRTPIFALSAPSGDSTHVIRTFG